MKRRTLALAVALALSAGSAWAQSGPLTVAVSTDSIEMGDVFELHVTLPIPPGSLVYFPDTLPATVNLESAATVRTAAEPTADGGARLTLTYPVIGFGVGTLPVPGFDVLTVPRGDDPGVEELPGGSAIGRWDDAPPRTGPASLTRIPREAVWVAPVFTPADIIQGVEPMPAHDVLGGNWSWPSLALVLLCSSVLVVTLVSTTRGWLADAGAEAAAQPEATLAELRERALRRLDSMLAEEIDSEGQLLDFYTRSSGIVRSYVEAMDSAWVSSLTSRELMGRLRQRSGAPGVGDLPTQMGTAEVVKFGRLRPASEAAKAHCSALRDWVEESGGRAW